MKKGIAIFLLILVSSITHAQTSPISLVAKFAFCMEKLCKNQDYEQRLIIDSLCNNINGPEIRVSDGLSGYLYIRKHPEYNHLKSILLDTYMNYYEDAIINKDIQSVKYSDFELCEVSLKGIKNKKRRKKILKEYSFVKCNLQVRTSHEEFN